MKKIILVLCISAFLVVGFSHKKLFAATIDEMIGQMIITGFNNKKYNSIKTISRQIKTGKIGGVIFYKRNIKDPHSLKKLNLHLSNIRSKHKPFIAIDQEGGHVARMDSSNGFVDFPSANEVSKMRITDVEKIYSNMANLLKKYNFNVNFAPCVDLNISQDSFINKRGRTYGKIPKNVREFAEVVIAKHSEQKIASSLKHFPGHGSSSGDSHEGFVDISNTWNPIELEPYKELLQKNVGQPIMVMVGHVYNENFDKNMPASLSKNVITGMLRDDLHFDGVVISDCLHMGAITNHFSLCDTVINAINAGIDILLFSGDQFFDRKLPIKISKIIKMAIKEGKIDISSIEKSYSRIVRLKSQLL